MYRCCLSVLIAIALSHAPEMHAQEGRWVRLDPTTRRYSVAARNVSRAELLADVAQVAGVDVRPRVESAETITLEASGLYLEDLVARILPVGSHVSIRPRGRDVAATTRTTTETKKGPPFQPPPSSKPKRADNTAIVKTGNLKPSPHSEPGRPATGERIKPSATEVQLGDVSQRKKPAEVSVVRATTRLTLRFVQGQPPVIIRAQTIEGEVPPQRYIMGPWLYAVVDSSGSPADYGTTVDPLEEHSYLQNGQHSVTRATEGVLGISLPRSRSTSGRLVIIDISSLDLGAELTSEVVRTAIARGKSVVTIDLAQVAHMIEEGDHR